MIEYITGAITLLIGIFIGHYLAKGTFVIPEETRKQIKKIIRSLPLGQGDLGAVSTPSALEVERFNNPIKKAEDEEMSKTFKDLIKSPGEETI